ncbi:hypothetical protein R3I93_016835 [Phoxinus phoxinus]|uniref:Immunoglobulin domain-containing protein n=1 Tax=Phoxinus phoxinus TaxID=58324 RepID=A0AAN9CM91_9TELE
MKDDHMIQWKFKNTLIAEINNRADRFAVYDDVFDGRFRDRLKLDNQTGSLTVTHTTTEHAGDYKLLINRERKRFSLTVNGVFGDAVTSVSVTVGDSVSLNSGLTEIQKGEQIIWTFGSKGPLIAKTDGVNNMIPDGRFGDRLKLDHQTGSLTITNIRTTDSGLYEVTISGSSSETKHRFSVTVYAATT